MSVKYASGKHAIAACDRCGFRFKLTVLKRLIIKTRDVNILVCPDCWEPDQPQLQLGMYLISDPQAVDNPRQDRGGNDTQWGWDPVGGAPVWVGTQNNLVAQGQVGTVTVGISIKTDVEVIGVAGYATLGIPAYVIDGMPVVVEVTGVTAAGAVGTVTTAYDYTIAVTGVSATASVGTVTVQISSTAIVTGVSATGYVGSVTAVVAAVHWLDVLWVNTAGASVGRGVAVDSANRLLIAGQTTDGGKYYIAQVDSGGVLQWQRSLDNTSYSSDTFEDVAVDSSNNSYAVGYAFDAVLALIKYDSSGAIQWQRSLGTSSTYGYGVAVSSSNNVFVTGATGSAMLLAKYNSSGTLQWQRTLTPGGGVIVGRKVTVDGSENSYVIGDWGGSGTILLVKYDSSGAIQWQQTLTSPTAARGYDVVLDGSGNVYITGIIYNSFSDSDIYIAKYNSSGVLQWQRQLGGASSNEKGYAITIDTSSNIYVAGTSTTTLSDGTLILAKYNSSGAIQWQREFTPKVTVGYSIAIDGAGNLCVVGTTDQTTLGSYGGIFLARMPTDGSLTGTYSGYTYAASSYTDAAASLTDASSSYTDAAGALTGATPSYTDAAATLTSSLYAIN